MDRTKFEQLFKIRDGKIFYNDDGFLEEVVILTRKVYDELRSDVTKLTQQVEWLVAKHEGSFAKKKTRKD